MRSKLSEVSDGSAETAGAMTARPANRWLAATRPQFLTITVVAVLVGLAGAAASGAPFDGARATLTLLGASLAHAGANLVNDFHDRDADAANPDGLHPFTGGSRMIQRGLLEARTIAAYGYALLAATAALGVVLAAGRPQLWGVGAVGLLLAIAYSAPPLRLSARGVGEAVIATAWLLVAVGADMAQRGAWSLTPVVAGLPLALLVAAILLANGYPDRRADAAAGKRTIVVRLGTCRATRVYLGLVAAAALWLAGAVAAAALPAWALAGLLPLALSLDAARRLRRHRDDDPVTSLLPAIRGTIAAAHLHGLLVAGALLLGAGAAR
jgi:1,4-dihydroxy-2-naphthoate octaprenyltransferase